MNRFFLALTLSLTPCLVLAQDWVETVAQDSAFRLFAPDSMQLKTDSVKTAVGTIAWHTYYLNLEESASSGNSFFILNYCDYPAFTVHSDSTELLAEFFESTIDQAVKTVEGKLRYVTDQTIQGFPGKLWRIDYLDEQAVIKTKAVVVRNRFYTIQVVSRRENHINRDADQFLDSFQVLKQ